jgi:molybdopterin-guanine dinucleotide biosynthesis protein A
MGADKADLCIDGQTLLERAVSRLRSVADPVIIAGGSRPREHPGCLSALDPAPDRGPLGGLVAALRASPHRLCAVVAVDMPDLSPVLIRGLADLWRGEHAVVPVSGGRVQPLHAVYSRDALPAAEAALPGPDLSLRHLLTLLEVREVDAAELIGPARAQDFATSLNTAGDLTRWRERAARDASAAAPPG